MKTKLTQEICQRMKIHLSAEQYKVLESTLIQVFDAYEIEDDPEMLPHIDERENTRLINLFIAAKKSKAVRKTP